MNYQDSIINGLIQAGLSLAIKQAYKEVQSIIKNLSEKEKEKVTLLLSQTDLENNIIAEIAKTSRWAYDDLFKNHKDHSAINSRYVHLDLLLEPRRDHTNTTQMLRKQPLKKIILANKSNTIILGQPGSGKTTSVKYITNSILHDPKFLNGVYRFPIVIRLRELNESNSIFYKFQQGGIFEKLATILGLRTKIEYTQADQGEEGKKGGKENRNNDSKHEEKDNQKLRMLLTTRIIPYLLDSQKILLILDGFDEIVDDSIRELVVTELKELRESLTEVNFILTSRSSGSDYKIKLEQTDVYEISDLDKQQIKEFSNKWFEDKYLSEKFLNEVSEKKHCADFCKRPLLLTQLAHIYSKTDEIPDKPKMIYQRIVEIVLKEWNEQQGIKRKSKYSTFTVERKKEFLSNLAFSLTTKYHKQVFTNLELASIYREINHKFRELPEGEAEAVVEEIESHNGLIIKSGFNSFEFSHLTLQEYFVADYIIRTGNINRLKYSELIKLPNELAISVALSSEPYIYLRDLLVNIIFKEDVDMDFSTTFFNRLKMEKPDFETDVIISINLVLLEIYTSTCASIQSISKMLDSHWNGKNQAMLNSTLAKKNSLEKIINSVCEWNVVGGLEKYYDLENTLYRVQKELYSSYRKKQDVISEFGLPDYFLWPK